jgi:hypothetical protein
MVPDWVAILALCLYLLSSKLEDWGFIEGKSKLWHSADAAGLGVIVSYVCLDKFGLTWTAAIACIDVLLFWWIFFDIGLNLKRGKPLFYVGSGTIDLTIKWIAQLINFESSRLMALIKLIALIIILIINYLHFL